MVIKGLCGIGGTGKSMMKVNFKDSFDVIPNVELNEETSSGVTPVVQNVTTNGFELLLDSVDSEKYSYWRGVYKATN